jgi:tRNA-dihydrouridine synthase B
LYHPHPNPLPSRERGSRFPAFRIGSILIDPPLVLAPMAGVTNAAFRLLCKRMGGCGLVCAEMISSCGLHYNNRRTREFLIINDEERPLSVQIWGAIPELMAEAAQQVQAAGADIVDINIGCPVPKVLKTGASGALLKDLDLAEKIIRAVVGAVTVPVTVKTRAGWNQDQITAVDLALRAQDAGAACIAVHGRTVQQGYTGLSDWTIIRKTKEVVTIPVIGNGDVRTPQDAERMIAETGCDGVMIGRGAMGNPCVFRTVDSYLTAGEALPGPSYDERLTVAWEHAVMLAAVQDEERAVRELRGQLAWYIKGRRGASEIRGRLSRASTLENIKVILDEASCQCKPGVEEGR